MAFPSEALPEDHFQGLGNIVGDAAAPRLHDLLNAVRLQMNGGGAYYVHPFRSDAFPTLLDAKEQADSDGREDVVFTIARGFDHDATGLLLDGEKNYIFAESPRDWHNVFNAVTKVSGIIDTTATTMRPGNAHRSIVVDGPCLSAQITIRQSRSLMVMGAQVDSAKVLMEQGAGGAIDSPRTSFLRCIFNGSFEIDAVDTPSPHNMSVDFYASNVSLSNISGAPLKFGYIEPRFVHCEIAAVFGTPGNPIMDFQNKGGSLDLLNNVFTSFGFGVTALEWFGNTANAGVDFGGFNLFYDPAAFAALPVQFDLWNWIDGSPRVDTQVLPLNPPLGTDYKDRGATEKWITWNGVAWV